MTSRCAESLRNYGAAERDNRSSIAVTRTHAVITMIEWLNAYGSERSMTTKGDGCCGLSAAVMSRW